MNTFFRLKTLKKGTKTHGAPRLGTDNCRKSFEGGDRAFKVSYSYRGERQEEKEKEPG